MRRVLIVDDDQSMCDLWSRVLCRDGFDVASAQTGIEALDKLSRELFDVVVLDLRMEPMNGVELLRRVRAMQNDITVVVLTARPSPQTAEECRDLGVYDYLTKPCSYADLEAALERALDYSWKHGKTVRLLASLSMRYQYYGMTVESEAMRTLCREVEHVGATDSPVMIHGAPGTEVDAVGRAIHASSRRANAGFYTFDCASEALGDVHRALFGRRTDGEDGSCHRIGLFELADGGTLLLRYPEALSFKMQAELASYLRYGRDRGSRRGAAAWKEDVRILSVGAPALTECVAAGQFREDLLEMLQQATIAIKPLTERREDIAPLMNWAMSEILGEGVEHPPVTSDVVALFEEYDWPRNVDELVEVVAYALEHKRDGVVTLASLPSALLRFTRQWVVGKDYVGPEDPNFQKSLRAYLESCRH